MELIVNCSARHIHLSKDDFHTLFGNNASLIKTAELLQPGQFVCQQTVKIKGTKLNRELEIRVLGPFRDKTQIEISRGDGIYLGIKNIPIKMSGNIKNTASCRVIGPYAFITLREGLIKARRHVHMSIDDAKYFNVEDNDRLTLEVFSGDLHTVYNDVIARISKDFILEVHLDTAEYNAAEVASFNKMILKSSNGQELIRNK